MFRDGVVLDTAGAPTPVHVPGHTSGSTAFLLKARGVLIAGDALVTVNLWNRRAGARLMPAEFNHDQNRAIQSLDRLKDLEADVIVTGHGQPFYGSPKEAVEEAFALL